MEARCHKSNTTIVPKVRQSFNSYSSQKQFSGVLNNIFKDGIHLKPYKLIGNIVLGVAEVKTIIGTITSGITGSSHHVHIQKQ